MEQRIARCRRINQQNQVVVLSLINRNNYADVRTLELVNKRTLLMDGVFGLTDDVIGGLISNLDGELADKLSQIKTQKEIAEEFQKWLDEREDDNKSTVEKAEDLLFSTFTKAAAKKIHITPRYVENAVAKLNGDLWDVVSYFFSRQKDFFITEATRSVRTRVDPLPKIFTGVKIGRDEYSMLDKSLPKSALITPNSSLARNVINEIFWQGISESGELKVDAIVDNCTIAFYEIKVANDKYYGGRKYNVFVGIADNGAVLDDKTCREIMALPVAEVRPSGNIVGKKDGLAFDEQSPAKTDKLIDKNVFVKRFIEETNEGVAEEILRLRHHTDYLKTALERDIVDTERAVSAPIKADNLAEQLSAEKRRSVMKRDLVRKESELFKAKTQLDTELESQIQNLTKSDKYVRIKRLFILDVRGEK
jgi:hypothetical protein